jgi:hypothetical protein
MRRFGSVLLLAIAWLGCSDTSTQFVHHEMTVTPKTLVYQHGDSIKTLSITHDCTCPFNWSVAVTPPNGVLKDTSGYMDNVAVPLRVIDRSKMTGDTLMTMVVVDGEFYGLDTVMVTVIR